jgi:hypothetical protein
MAKIDRVLVPLVLFKPVPGVSVATKKMRVVKHLKQTVMFYYPVYFFRDKGSEDRCTHFTVRMWGKFVADIM